MRNINDDDNNSSNDKDKCFGRVNEGEKRNTCKMRG